MIPPGFIQDLIARTDIVQVVGRHVELKKGGANLMGLCPFHGEKTPSFSVSPSKQFYHCFGCGANGDAIGFLVEHNGMSFVEAVQELAQSAGMKVPDDERSPQERERAAEQKKHQATLSDVLQRAAGHYRAQLKLNRRAIDYLKGRGLTGQIAARFGLGYAPDGWRNLASGFPSYDDPLLIESGLVIQHEAEGHEEAKRYDRFRDRVMFPIRNVQGETIGFGGRVLDRGEPKYLNSPETPVFHKGRELYGLFENRTGMRQRGYALVVEGYMDVVALSQHGFENAVATLGTACTAEHVQKLFRLTDSVVFSFDGDAAGRRAAARALEAALPHANEQRTVRFLFLPPEHDPDSFVRELGTEAFDKAVQGAIPLSRYLLQLASDGCDLSSPEGRAKLLANAKPLWSSLPEGLLPRQLLGEIARLAQLPEAELMQSWQGTAPAEPSKPTRASGPKAWQPNWMPQRTRQQGLRRMPVAQQDQVVRLLLQNSALWLTLSEDDQALLHNMEGDHGDLIRWLEREIVNHGPQPWASVPAGVAAAGLQDGLTRVLRSGAGLLEDAEPERDLQASLVVLKLDWVNAALLATDPFQDRDAYAELLKLQATLKRSRYAAFN